MSNCNPPSVNEKPICDHDRQKIADILETEKSSVFVFTIDKSSITFFKPENAESTFDLEPQRFRAIVPTLLMITENDHATVSMGGDSTTRSFPI